MHNPNMQHLPTNVTAIILAAGESKRMGEENKLLLSFKGKHVIQHVVEAVVGAEVRTVYVVVGHEQEQVRSVLRDYPITFVENPAYEEGMGTSIRAGIAQATDEAAGYMVCLSDLPLITSEEYSALAHAFLEQKALDEQAIVIPEFQGQRGNPVILSSAYRQAMLAQQGVMGCKGIVKQHPEHVHKVEMSTPHVTFDIDTPEAYQRLVQDYSA